ncbi:hypothetical protein GCM10027406_32750 [Leifsonia lichenia]
MRGGGRLRFSARQVLEEWDAVLGSIHLVVEQEVSRDTRSGSPFGRRAGRVGAESPSGRRAVGRVLVGGGRW